MQGSSLLILPARLVDFSASALTEVVAPSARGPVAGCSCLCATGRWCRSRLLALQGVDHAHRPEAEQVERATALPAKHALNPTQRVVAPAAGRVVPAAIPPLTRAGCHLPPAP